MKIIKLLTFVSFLFIVGCTGVKFAQSPVNSDVPESFKTRALYPAGVAAYDFQDLVGNVLSIKLDNSEPIRIGMITPNNYKTESIPIIDPLQYYKSRIQLGAQVKGNYLAFAATLDAEQLVELELIDIARATIPFDVDSIFSQILTKANAWVTNHPKTDMSRKRLWIKSVILTKRVYTEFINVGANASGQVGDVVGVKTGVYNKQEINTKSVLIGFEAFDIDKLVDLSISNKILNLDKSKLKNEIINSTVYTGVIEGNINKSE